MENGKILKKYYSNGKLEYEYEYVNGTKNRISKEYYENGQLKFEISYLNGKINRKKNFIIVKVSFDMKLNIYMDMK